MSEIFTIFYDYQIRLNLYHFQTDSYDGHKASDEHLVKFRGHFDRFLEVWQGVFGKIEFKKPDAIEFTNIKEKSEIIEATQMVNEFVEGLADQLEELGQTYLVSLIDEIVADNNQFLYLLTFS